MNVSNVFTNVVLAWLKKLTGFRDFFGFSGRTKIYIYGLYLSLMSTLSVAAKLSIEEISAVADRLPAVVIIHNVLNDFSVEYMSANGLQKLGVTLDELKEMGSSYHSRFFNEVDTEFYRPRVEEFINRNDPEQIITLFQQVRKNEAEPYSWYLSSMRILLQDEAGQPYLVITHATPIEPELHIVPKVTKLLEDRALYRDNISRYQSLSKRERDVLALLAEAKTNKQISEALYISINTVETHKKSLKLKLEAATTSELIRLARAFEG